VYAALYLSNSSLSSFAGTWLSLLQSNQSYTRTDVRRRTTNRAFWIAQRAENGLELASLRDFRAASAGNAEMDLSLEDARAMYWAAYEANRACAARVAKVLAAGDVPSDEDVKAEQRTLSELNTARRRLFDAMVRRG
jgi:hypothetical protein